MKNRDKELLAVGILGTAKLGDRIEMLLKRGRDFSPRASFGRVAVCAIALLAITLAGSRAPHWIAFAQQAPRPSFEVTSVKPADTNDQRFFIGSQPGGRFTANANLKMLIGTAYDVRNHQISGGPSWIESAKFEIEAKAENGADFDPRPNGGGRVRLMLQSLLEERFKLALHREIKEEQVYELTVAKGGPKLKEVADPGKGGQQGMRMGRGQLIGMAAPIAILVNVLSQQLGRSVIDKTGLAGKYDFTLTYTPDAAQSAAFGPPGPDAPPPPDPNGPSIFTAIQEQLGLKLESAKGPVDVLVIDHAEKPGAN
jgi:bla regulator protein BlaR1